MTAPISTTDLDLILTHTRDLWTEARGQRIFLTGGTGFFGCWLVESFLHANRALKLDANIVVLTRNPTVFAQKCPHLQSDPALTLIPGDVRDFKLPPNLESAEFRYVIHAATEASARQAAEEPLEMFQTILHGTERTLEFASTHGTRKFLLTSSGAVYGEQPASITHLPEDYAGAPNPLVRSSVYAEGKRAAELLCALYANAELECKIARCFAFVGPHLPLDAHFAIGNFLRDAMRGQPIQINGDGTPMRSYMYAADLAIWLWTMLFRAPSIEAFNVGSEDAISIANLARAVDSALGANTPIYIAQQAQSDTPPRQYVPSTQKAEQLFGLHATVPLDEAIRRTAAWHRHSAQPLNIK
jgi:nucleoside-diphosphate-sugar epimerase